MDLIIKRVAFIETEQENLKKNSAGGLFFLNRIKRINLTQNCIKDFSKRMEFIYLVRSSNMILNMLGGCEILLSVCNVLFSSFNFCVSFLVVCFFLTIKFQHKAPQI